MGKFIQSAFLPRNDAALDGRVQPLVHLVDPQGKVGSVHIAA